MRYIRSAPEQLEKTPEQASALVAVCPVPAESFFKSICGETSTVRDGKEPGGAEMQGGLGNLEDDRFFSPRKVPFYDTVVSGLLG
jgi:hypothetical protein